MAYINLYNNNPTVGLTDGNVVSLNGAQTNPVSVSLDASLQESKTVKMAIRCDSGYQTQGSTTISFTGTSAGYWSICDTENGTYTSSLTIASVIDATNTIFYVKAASATSETPSLDTSVFIQVVTKVEALS